MNPNLAIIEADSVKLFPSINLPAHIPTDNVEINKKKNITINNPKYNKGNFNTQNSSKNLELPGLLRTLKNSIGSKAFDQSSADRTVIGFTASNLHLDSGEIPQETGRLIFNLNVYIYLLLKLRKSINQYFLQKK